ncbi:MDR family MFS transporter [Lactobacillus ultunensis]|nr:MDR family MFS transporter [Lactobacillus ultunensis]KRL82825.1 MFS family major facilitator transporter, multidrug cation symporter [Lactobacillus ultunensis DSM 16047]QQP28822.1 multidrug efflux MFS transporter [Lactobacillus ultunensis]
MKPLERRLLVFTILLGGFLSTLTETILNNALPTIMQAFNISQSVSQWLSTGYILVVGIMMPTAAYFFNRVPLRTLFITTLFIFLMGTIIASTAQTFEWLLAGRIIQAISVGISMPLTQNVLTLVYPPSQRGAALGLAAIVIILGPAIGPTLSGWIVNHYPWEWIFIILLPLTVLAIILSFFTVKNINQPKPTKLSWSSLLLSTVGFGLLLYGFSNIGVIAGINTFTLIILIIGLIVTAAFIILQLKLKKPLLQMRVFKSPSFTKTTILASLINVAMLGTELIVPLYLQDVRGVSAFISGLLLLPGAILMAIVAPIAGRLLDLHGIKGLSFIGFGILTLATIPMIWFNDRTSLPWIVFLYAIRMGAISLVMMPVTTSGINALPERLIVHGNSVVATFRQIASSLGTAGLVTVAAVISNGHTHGVQLMHGYQGAFAVAALVSLICLIISFTLRNRTKPEL